MRRDIHTKFIEKQEHYNTISRPSIQIPLHSNRFFHRRVSNNTIDTKAFEYPFSFIMSGDYPLKYCIESSEITRMPLFPNEISEWIWADVRERSWTLICRVKDVYIFYEASCSKMGFTIQYIDTPTPLHAPGSSMRIVLGNSLEYIIRYGLSDAQYNSYIQTTTPSNIFSHV